MYNYHFFYRSMGILLATSLLCACANNPRGQELQITSGAYNHDLDSNDNFSPDDQWLVYDIKTAGAGIGGSPRIEKVNVESGEIVVLYELTDNQRYGPGVAAVSYSHSENKVVFIHGLMSASADNPYRQWRRSGVIVDEANLGEPIFMDARDVTYPFTPGALRGGTHRHEWSGDGDWIGYTYNDAVMQALEARSGQRKNLRTIGVSTPVKPVAVDKDPAGENISGEWFSAVVVTVVPEPVPGSDEISKASGDSWVGDAGYRKTDGSVQRARGFIGIVRGVDGNDVEEVFVVDIPSDITQSGKGGPLEGTLDTMPSPPAGTVQRRLTYTAATQYPGTGGNVRSSADGNWLTYVAYDSHGIKQIFTLSPQGGIPQQQTFHDSNVQSEARWHPNNRRICYVWNNRVISKMIDEKSYSELTTSADLAPFNLVWSHDGNSIAYNRRVENIGGGLNKQIFVVRFLPK